MNFLRRIVGAADGDLQNARARPIEAFSGRHLYPLPSTALLGIAGERHHEREVRAMLKAAANSPPAGLDEYAQRIAEEEREKIVWFAAELIPDRSNRYDSNAVAVWTSQGHVGFLDRDHAADYRQVFDFLEKHGYQGGLCPAFGRLKEQQIVLCLALAHRCHDHLRGEFVYRPAWEALRAGHDSQEVAQRFGYAGTGPLRRAVRAWAVEHSLPDPESNR